MTVAYTVDHLDPDCPVVRKAYAHLACYGGYELSDTWATQHIHAGCDRCMEAASQLPVDSSEEACGARGPAK